MRSSNERAVMDIDIAKFERCRLLVVGDLMLDEYVWGKVDRISPEAPVQVVSVNSEQYTLGGCGNVVNNLVSLGAAVSVLGVTGTGRNARLMLDKFDELGVDRRGIIQEQQRPTTRKTRIIAEHQQVLRIDRETKKEIATQTFDALVELAEELIAKADAILLSDYGKGLITRPLVARLAALAEAAGKVIIADPKGLDFTKYAGISLLTPNRREAALAAGIEISDQKSLTAAGNRLLEKSGVQKILITCGKDGMVFFEPGKKTLRFSTRAREVYDVSGAGDTVVAVLGLGIAAGLSFRQAISLANTAAGIVVGKVGTATVSRSELSRALQSGQEKSFSKQKTINELAQLCRRMHKDHKRIVLTNGCFDLLHVGHIQLLASSKQLGDVLIVALDDDESVKGLKGAGRPVIGAAQRVRILSALDSVDYVVVFATRDLDKVIEAVQPDVLTKGSNYNTAKVLGRKIVEQYGGRVELIPVTEAVSSSQIIKTIQST
jgi:D-beta-D-heptose 7-phosphate kinase/D-beta-D-heptose 1-phosphate adenosyltransferase